MGRGRGRGRKPQPQTLPQQQLQPQPLPLFGRGHGHGTVAVLVAEGGATGKRYSSSARRAAEEVAAVKVAELAAVMPTCLPILHPGRAPAKLAIHGASARSAQPATHPACPSDDFAQVLLGKLKAGSRML